MWLLVMDDHNPDSCSYTDTVLPYRVPAVILYSRTGLQLLELKCGYLEYTGMTIIAGIALCIYPQCSVCSSGLFDHLHFQFSSEFSSETWVNHSVWLIDSSKLILQFTFFINKIHDLIHEFYYNLPRGTTFISDMIFIHQDSFHQRREGYLCSLIHSFVHSSHMPLSPIIIMVVTTLYTLKLHGLECEKWSSFGAKDVKNSSVKIMFICFIWRYLNTICSNSIDLIFLKQ